MDTKTLPTANLRALLGAALEQGLSQVGQVSILILGTTFRLTHLDDRDRKDLQIFCRPHDATQIALLDDAGAYRPLKTAPDLRHGWQLNLACLADLHLALDLIYPAAIGNWRAWLKGDLPITPLRDLVNRQTGMYRITGKATTEQAREVRQTLCQTGCKRHILWSIEPDEKVPNQQFADKNIPLLCPEACCIFVATTRKVVKGIPLDQIE